MNKIKNLENSILITLWESMMLGHKAWMLFEPIINYFENEGQCMLSLIK